jgi:competence protein ComEC
MPGERPLLIPCLALTAGLVCADRFDLLLPLTSVAALFCCLLLSSLIRNPTVMVVCTFLFFFGFGLHALSPWKSPPASGLAIRQHASGTALVVEGIIRSRPQTVATMDGVASSFVLDTESVIRDGRSLATHGKLMVSVGRGALTLQRGDRVRLATRIRIPHRLGLPGEFDYPRFLAFQGISATARVASLEEIVLIRGAAEESLQAPIDLTALRMGEFIRSSLPDERISSIVTALLIGDQRRIPQQLADAYTRAGVNHILSISGFHVGIIAFFIVQVGLLVASRFERLALRFNLPRSMLLLALPAMIYYLFLTGCAAATARSVIMLAALVLALYAERETDPINMLLLAAMLLLTVNPPSLFDASFQLSFLALWGILIAVPPVMQRFSPIHPNWQRSLLQFIVASCAASAVTAIPVLFLFNQASLNGILSNFLIVPLLGYGAVLTGFTALPFVELCAPLARTLLWLSGELVQLSNWLVMLLARLPLLRFHGISQLDMLAFFMCLSAVTFVRPARLRIVICGVAASLVILVHLTGSLRSDGRLHITMLSVGQAESLLLRLPDNSTMLVDGGGYLHDSGRDFGERVLGPALFKLGVRRIDRMVLSHSHPDHVGGFPYLARTIPVGEFWEAAPGGSGPLYDQLRTALTSRRVPMRLLSAGDFLQLPGGVTISVISPPRAATEPFGRRYDEMGLNEESLVFRLSYGKLSCLFTGDAGFPAEERMLEDGGDLSSTLLKLGHHGSRHSTSQELLDRVAPRVAFVSAGRNNSFGLPAPMVLNRLARHGIRVFRTDQDGSIELVSDGTAWNITTPWRPE